MVSSSAMLKTVLIPTETVPVVAVGVTHCASADETTVAREEKVLPNRHAVMPAMKPEPVRVTTVPPTCDPEDGSMKSTWVVESISTCAPSSVDPRLLKESSTDLNPADLGGTVQVTMELETYLAWEDRTLSSSVIGLATEQYIVMRGEKLFPRTVRREPEVPYTDFGKTEVTLMASKT